MQHTTFCRICESLCGLNIQVEAGEVTAIKPDQQHVATNGFACPKGLKQHQLFNSPDRLQAPRKKTAEGWQDISWDAALAEMGTKIKQIRQDHGGDALSLIHI